MWAVYDNSVSITGTCYIAITMHSQVASRSAALHAASEAILSNDIC